MTCIRSRFLFVMAFAWAVSACGGEMSMPSSCGSRGRTGQTDCSGVTTCGAGQYCDDSVFPTCTPGCTSDANCGPSEFCARPAGEAIGACQSCPVCGNGACEPGESASNCAADCGGGSVCGNGACEPDETPSSCPADCTDTSLAPCYDNCQSYEFFDCFAAGQLDACRSSCTAATMAQREQFNSCAATETTSCNTSCLDFL